MNNNTQFLDSELIKEEVDDMEECLDHFEAAESAFPLCGRTLSDNEMSEVLDVLQNKTCFSIEKDMFDANDVEMDLSAGHRHLVIPNQGFCVILLYRGGLV